MHFKPERTPLLRGNLIALLLVASFPACGHGDLEVDSSVFDLSAISSQSGGGGGGGCTLPTLANPTSVTSIAATALNLVSTTDRIAQAFQLPSPVALAAISVRLSAMSATTTNLQIEIRPDSGGGTPSNSDPLQMMTLPIYGSETNTWITANFGSGAPGLAANTTYWAVFSVTSTHNLQFPKVMMPDNIPGFGVRNSASSGVTWSTPGSGNDDILIQFHTCN